MHNHKSIRRSRGSAMTEMVLVLPFFLLILSLLVYLGRGVVRVQHTQVVDRYEAWRATSGAPGPTADNRNRNSELNQAFFMNKATDMEVDEHNIRVTAFDDLFRSKVEEDARQTPEGTLLAHTIYTQNAAWFFAHVKTVHDMSANLWNRLDGPMYHTHIRMGHDWSFATLWRQIPDEKHPNELVWVSFGGGGREEGSITDTYFTKLDNALDGLSRPELAQRIQGLYNKRNPIPYVGPTVKF